MAVWVSKLMNALCQPLVRRTCNALLPHQESLQESLRRSLEPAILPIVLKHEIDHMQQFPDTFLGEEDLVVIGFASKELGRSIKHARCITPPIADDSVLAGTQLVFLDEYHFITLIRQVPTLLIQVRESIFLPYCGDYLCETTIRHVLHQLGFAEIFLLECDRLANTFAVSGVSHPAPVSSLPVMVTPTAESTTATRWLVASRYPAYQ